MSILLQGQLQLVELIALIAILPLIVIIPIVVFIKRDEEYKGGAYYQSSKQSYISVALNTGKYGEYLIYEHLKKFEENGAKFLFNVYIPKADGNATEIDALMICSKGILVFESKNYSGWIFGNEEQQHWCQTLPAGRGQSHKEHFYNPVLQNRYHIKHLRAFLGQQIPMWSIIAFSDRCSLKRIHIKSNDVHVVNRHNIGAVVSNIYNQTVSSPLSTTDIIILYNKLYPYTQVDSSLKTQHVTSVQGYNTTQPRQTLTPALTPRINPIETATKDSTTLKCPTCGGKLILRTATRGSYIGKRFYGCSNYPKCRFIRNIER